MKMPPTVTLNELSALYDVFFIDQFGVLRGGEVAYAGASQALVHLKAQGKTIVILSNSGRSGPYNISRLAKLGFDSSSFDRFVTSGDVAPALLESGLLPIERSKSTRCLTIASGEDRSLADNLGFSSVDTAEEADLVIISGSETERIPLASYRALLLPAAKRGVPCICTNPDVHKLVGETLLPAAGTIAALYEEMGGKVTRIGKPYVDIYRHAHALCGHPDKARIVAIGDSLEHDVIGAATFGIDSALTLTGLQAHVSEAALLAQMQEGQIAPRYLLGSFVWIE
ncbi:MAG: TIGR01459 family HAD-type hydrolase [Hyphomicrobiales bacterium]|jgi:HAD superfamily hydrolase (TIGR01459 family)|nr:TIGR01459 family HAD-type hydrolase [Hyphomicrobiales bacterium]MBP9173779.1 TIGR01459 family HAD-type hydrolase [Hyphomicrobiales bacterium]MCC7480086.1 TIGR01459 family HAD-type hydrolase [Hyphomicrobiales bacterium]